MQRKTNETDINLELNIYGSQKINIDTQVGFLNHMLELLAYQASFDLNINACGDTNVDAHHLVEDIGIILGQEFKNELDKNGIRRYGQSLLPMDETLVLIGLDISNRGYLNFDASFTSEFLGEMASELIEEFFQAFVRTSQVTLHIKCLDFKNNHHLAEAIFKGFGRALRDACTIEGTKVNSTKGIL